MAIAPLAGPIVLLAASLERGCPEALLARQLQEWGWPVRLVAMTPSDDLGAKLDHLEVVYLGMTPSASGFGPGALRRFRQLVKSERPAALVGFTCPAILFGRIVGRAFGIPVIVSNLHDEGVGKGLERLALRLTARLDTLTTTNGPAEAASLARRGLATEERLRVIPEGIDLTRFLTLPARAPEVRAELGAAPGEFVWLSVGRLAPSEDYPNLLQAVRLLPAAPRHRVYVAGGGELHQALTRQASAMGLAERVRFLGRRDDIPRLLSAADAIVLPSDHDGVPHALMEALAAGRPAVATDVGGVREVMIDGISGYVVPRHQPTALADAMARLMTDPLEVRATMGEAGREHVESHFSVTAMAERWRAMLAAEVALRTPRLVA